MDKCIISAYYDGGSILFITHAIVRRATFSKIENVRVGVSDWLCAWTTMKAAYQFTMAIELAATNHALRDLICVCSEQS